MRKRFCINGTGKSFSPSPTGFFAFLSINISGYKNKLPICIQKIVMNNKEIHKSLNGKVTSADEFKPVGL